MPWIAMSLRTWVLESLGVISPFSATSSVCFCITTPFTLGRMLLSLFYGRCREECERKVSVRLSAEGSLQNIVIWEVQELTKWSVPSSGTQRSGKHVPGGLTRSLHLLCLLDFENQTRYGWKGKSGKVLLLGPRSPECVCAEGVSVVYFWSSNDGKRWPLIRHQWSLFMEVSEVCWMMETVSWKVLFVLLGLKKMCNFGISK